MRPDAVVHLAALLTADARDDPVAATRVNALGTAIVFEAARAAGVRRVDQEAIDWTFVDDAAEIVARAVEAPLSGHHVFNVAGDKRTMADAVAVLRALRPLIRFEKEPATTPVSAWTFANDRLEPMLGVRPGTNLREGIVLMSRLLDA